MQKHLFLLLALLIGATSLDARPVDETRAMIIGQKFASANFSNYQRNNELKLVYTGTSSRGEACFYTFNIGETGFVIVSADDRFRPIVGYSDEGTFDVQNMSPDLAFYLGKIIEARTSPNAVIISGTEEEWQSVASSGRMLSRNGGRGVNYLCTTKWNQDSPYNLYAPEASNGPGGRCYAGCVATAMSQIMKYWDYPVHGNGSHTYDAGGWWGPYYPNLSANFGATTYDWKNMPIWINNGSPQVEIEAIATLMYHCGVAVNMGFAYNGSGANSEDVPYAIEQYFSYSSQAELKHRDSFTLTQWQNRLKESFDLGWPVYYSGYSNEGGHAFVCDGYDDNNLFHYNWGWGGSGDGWFVVDEIDYAGWAGAIFNFVPSHVYNYMPMQPENFSVVTSGDYDYAATLQWTNPTQNIHFNNLTSIDKIVVCRNGEIIHTENNVTPGADMTFTDYYIPAIVNYSVYAVVNDAKGLIASEDGIILGPTCHWTIEMTSTASDGWNSGALSFTNNAGQEVAHVSLTSTSTTKTIQLPAGHVNINWIKCDRPITKLSFNIKDSEGKSKVSFEGSYNEIQQGLFYIANNTCGNEERILDGPENLTATSSGNSTVLSWDALEGRNVINYQVYRDDKLFAITYTTSFTDTEPVESFRTYHVAAVTDEGETLRSNACNLQPEVSCTMPINLRYEMINNTKVKISWDAPQAEGLTGYYVYRRIKGGEFKRVKALTGTTYSDNLNSRDDAHYEYVVSAYYRNEDCHSAYASSQEHPELNYIEVNKTIIPQNLRFLIHEGHVILQWDKACMAERYCIYRNGVLIGHSSGTDYVDYTANSSQSYRYTVTGQNAHLESNPSNEVFVDWTTTIDEKADEQAVVLFPNPTSGMVYVESHGLQEVRVFNMMGQEMIRQSAVNNQTSIDMTHLPEGTYFVKILGSHNAVKKVVKIQ